MGSLGVTFQSLKAYILMVFLQFGYAGMYIIAVYSLKRGMNHYVLVVYRNISAAIFMAPFAYFFERKVRPKMTLSIFLKISLLGLLEPVLDQNLYYAGAKLTSASFSAALFNIIPAITFVIAVCLRMEYIKMSSIRTQGKIIGSLVTVVGALVMILYSGPNLHFPWTNTVTDSAAESQSGGDFIKGTILLIMACTCWACFFVLQSHTIQLYTAEMSLSTWICFMGAAESAAVTLVMEKGAVAPWVIGWDVRLVTAVYSGVVCSGIAYYVQGIVGKERGPVFITAFNPLCMILVSILGSLFLSEQISLGKLLGAIVIVAGLYLLIWGKSKDYINTEKQANAKSLELPVYNPDKTTTTLGEVPPPTKPTS